MEHKKKEASSTLQQQAQGRNWGQEDTLDDTRYDGAAYRHSHHRNRRVHFQRRNFIFVDLHEVCLGHLSSHRHRSTLLCFYRRLDWNKANHFLHSRAQLLKFDQRLGVDHWHYWLEGNQSQGRRGRERIPANWLKLLRWLDNPTSPGSYLNWVHKVDKAKRVQGAYFLWESRGYPLGYGIS